jgi:D-3-phosphoglycerate dehydrogenase / 2-oxoglutarate reductase
VTDATSFPKSQIRVVLFENIHERAGELFTREGFQVETIAHAPGSDELSEILAEAHVVGIRSKTHIEPGHLAGARRLLAAGCFCIGTNQVDLDAAAEVGTPVFNAPFSNTRSVAELTIAETISLLRRLFPRSIALHAGRWEKSASGSHEVRSRTLGIVGYGHIGTQVSILAEALGMRVVYFDIEPKLPLGNARAMGSLDELLAQADVVTLHVPATGATENLIGPNELATMKPGSFLINNARGSVVDISALAAALRSGHLAGAAVDVFPVEPASKSEPFESELRNLENVILSPHIGGSTVEAQASIAEEVATKIIRFINIGSTTGAVNVPRVELPAQPKREVARPDTQRPHRILHFHRNVPGVLSNLHAAIAQLGINVTSEYLQTDPRLGYVVLDVSPSDASELLKRIRAMPETIRTRVLW